MTQIKIIYKNIEIINQEMFIKQQYPSATSIKLPNLSDSAETPGGDLLGVQLHGVLGEVKPLLHDRGQLTDPNTMKRLIHTCVTAT